jgi:hypothetical protein
VQQHNNTLQQEARDTSKHLLDGCSAIRHYQDRLCELKDSVARYEERFGIPSNQIHDAIENNTLIETEEVCDWIMAYELLIRVQENSSSVG